MQYSKTADMHTHKVAVYTDSINTLRHPQSTPQVINNIKKSLSYDGRFYLHLERDGEIYYYDIETTISVELHEDQDFKRNMIFNFGEIRIKDTCSKTHLFLQNKVEELLKHQNKSFCINNQNSSSIQSNPFFIALSNSLFNVSTQQESNTKSQLLSNLTIQTNLEASETRRNYWFSDKKIESTIIRVDNDQLKKELHTYKLESELSNYRFNFNVQNSMFRNMKYPTSISYTQDESLGDKVRLYIAMGLKDRKKASVYKLYNKVFSILRSNISACL